MCDPPLPERNSGATLLIWLAFAAIAPPPGAAVEAPKFPVTLLVKLPLLPPVMLQLTSRLIDVCTASPHAGPEHRNSASAARLKCRIMIFSRFPEDRCRDSPQAQAA